jgi:hypothetical protein
MTTMNHLLIQLWICRSTLYSIQRSDTPMTQTLSFANEIWIHVKIESTYFFFLLIYFPVPTTSHGNVIEYLWLEFRQMRKNSRNAWWQKWIKEKECNHCIIKTPAPPLRHCLWLVYLSMTQTLSFANEIWIHMQCQNTEYLLFFFLIYFPVPTRNLHLMVMFGILVAGIQTNEEKQ